MNPRGAELIAKAHLATEMLISEGKQPPPELIDQDFAVLYLIREASQFAHGEKNAGSPFSYEELFEKKLKLLLKNGMATQRELDRLKPILKEYQVHETDNKFYFLHALLNLISTIPDIRAQELLKLHQEKLLHERARENKAVGHRIRPKGPPPYRDDAEW